MKDQLLNNTQRSVDRGTFGSPTFFVGDEILFGKDRLREVEELIAQSSRRSGGVDAAAAVSPSLDSFDDSVMQDSDMCAGRPSGLQFAINPYGCRFQDVVRKRRVAHRSGKRKRARHRSERRQRVLPAKRAIVAGP